MKKIIISTTSNNEYILLENLNNANSGIANVTMENRTERLSVDLQTIIEITGLVISIAQLAISLYQLKNTTKDIIKITIKSELIINGKELHEIEEFLKKELNP